MAKKADLTTKELLDDMKARGLSISQKTLSEGIESGVFPFVRVLGVGETGRRNLLILRRDYEDWAEKYLCY